MFFLVLMNMELVNRTYMIESMIWSLVGDFTRVVCCSVSHSLLDSCFWSHLFCDDVCFRILFFGFGPAQKFADDDDFF